GFNRYISSSTGPSIRPITSESQGLIDLHQGRRTLAKAQQIRHTSSSSSLIDDDPRFVMSSNNNTTNESKFLISDYQGLVRQFSSGGGGAVRLQTPLVVDEETLALDRAVTEANVKLDMINAQIASIRSEAQELESQINSLKSELITYQEIVDRGSPVISSPYSLSLRNNADFDLNNKTFVNKFLRKNNHKKTDKDYHTTSTTGATAAADAHQTTTTTVLPQSLPYVNAYAWPLPNSIMRDQPSSGEQRQHSILPKSSLFRLDPHNLRLAILYAGRRELPGYDVEKKRLSHINWSYPSSRPNFAECWRFRLSQIRINNCQKDMNSYSFGLDLANIALLLRTLWHCIRWDDMLMEPDKDLCVHDSNGRPCFKKTLHIDDDDDEDDDDVIGGGGGVSNVPGKHDDNKPYSVRRIVEIQPL
ncbi:unnamed protein product, partial [Schistosoma turkestanicum]